MTQIKINNPFDFNSFLPEARDRRWLVRRKQWYQNPQQYKEHLKQQSDEHWKQAISGGVSKEMSEKEAIRKKNEAEKKAKEEEEKRLAALGPSFPKVWDLNYVKEYPRKIFKKKSNDELGWDFFKFKIYVNETEFCETNFYENLDELKWKNTHKIRHSKE